MPMTTISLALLTALRDHGARQIFGIPGDFALAFFKVIEESGILPLYSLSHEPAVGFAADAAARYHCAPSVAAVTYGAGALNVVNAVAAAYAERSPVVVVSGAPGHDESRAGLLLHHQAKTLDSQFRIFREITCEQVRLDDPRSAPTLIATALAACRTQSRPVYIELPRDCVHTPCADVEPVVPDAVDPDALCACVDEVLERLASARSPVLLVCVEVRRYGLEAKVAELARKLGIPVVTSFMGRGLLSETDAPLLGTYMGLAGDPEITQRVESSDALVLLGTIVSDTNFGVSERKIDLRHSIQAREGVVTLGFHTYPAIPLAAFVDAMLGRLHGRVDSHTRRASTYPRGLPADDAEIDPASIAMAINDLMERHGRMPIASDVGDCLFTTLEIENTELVAPGYYAGMGFGVPAGLGLQAASGRRPLVLVGDGAFQMTGWELGNCRRYGWDPIVVVFNNRSWEMLRAFQPESRFNDLDDWNFAAMATPLGGDGYRVSTRAELGAALEQAIGHRGRFQLIEAMIPRGRLSSTLARFVGAVRRLSEGGQTP